MSETPHSRGYSPAQHIRKKVLLPIWRYNKQTEMLQGTARPEFVDGFYIQEGGNFFANEVKVLKSKGYCQETTNGASVQETTNEAIAENSDPTVASESDKENKK